MCVHNDKWTEVHWDRETKTYSLGASIPQLDKYDTEGSDIQVLIDKELEKTSEEDTMSKAESEEELKEPGPSINQQIHLTPIAQSLKASPSYQKQAWQCIPLPMQAQLSPAPSQPPPAPVPATPPPSNYVTNYNKSSEGTEEDQMVQEAQEDQVDLTNQTQPSHNNLFNQLQM